MNYTSDFLRDLAIRGFIHQTSDDTQIDTLAQNKQLIAYIGFDCTAPSLHVGNLISILLLRKLQQAGGKPIVLLGGGTTKIGDPSGKDETRQLLTPEKIEDNKRGIALCFERFLDFGDGSTDALMVDNADWLDELNYIDLLRNVGPHFSVNRMLSFDSVRLRLEREQPLSFIEFNYMILQAYDYVELNKRYGCNLQMGGSDQWGNIVNGIELGRRMAQKSLYALTSPLLTTASGAKMGKSAQGAIWLNSDMLSPYDYWQFWRNSEDADVIRFLHLFTELPLDEIDRLSSLQGADLNEAKKILANAATAMAHGTQDAQKAAATAQQTFEAKHISTDLPHITLPRTQLEQEIGLLEAFVIAGLAESNGAARRLVQGGGARVNDCVISDPHKRLTMDDMDEQAHIIKLSAGKKKHILLKFSA